MFNGIEGSNPNNIRSLLNRISNDIDLDFSISEEEKIEDFSDNGEIDLDSILGDIGIDLEESDFDEDFEFDINEDEIDLGLFEENIEYEKINETLKAIEKNEITSEKKSETKNIELKTDHFEFKTENKQLEEKISLLNEKCKKSNALIQKKSEIINSQKAQLKEYSKIQQERIEVKELIKNEIDILKETLNEIEVDTVDEIISQEFNEIKEESQNIRELASSLIEMTSEEIDHAFKININEAEFIPENQLEIFESHLNEIVNECCSKCDAPHPGDNISTSEKLRYIVGSLNENYILHEEEKNNLIDKSLNISIKIEAIKTNSKTREIRGKKETLDKITSTAKNTPTYQQAIKRIADLQKREVQLKQILKEKESEINTSLKEARKEIDEINKELNTLALEIQSLRLEIKDLQIQLAKNELANPQNTEKETDEKDKKSSLSNKDHFLYDNVANQNSSILDEKNLDSFDQQKKILRNKMFLKAKTDKRMELKSSDLKLNEDSIKKHRDLKTFERDSRIINKQLREEIRTYENSVYDIKHSINHFFVEKSSSILEMEISTIKQSVFIKHSLKEIENI